MTNMKIEINKTEVSNQYDLILDDLITETLEVAANKGSATVSFNIAPAENTGKDIDFFMQSLEHDANYLNCVKAFIQEAYHKAGDKIEVDSDFYWDDEDLLIRVTLLKGHPFIPKP